MVLSYLNRGDAMRPDRNGAHRQAYDRNRKILLKTQNTCGICGHPVNVNIKSPDPMSPAIDHIIPINKGGHPSDINNLQLTHRHCNRQKSDKMFNEPQQEKKVLGNRNLPQTINWMTYKS